MKYLILFFIFQINFISYSQNDFESFVKKNEQKVMNYRIKYFDFVGEDSTFFEAEVCSIIDKQDSLLGRKIISIVNNSFTKYYERSAVLKPSTNELKKFLVSKQDTKYLFGNIYDEAFNSPFVVPNSQIWNKHKYNFVLDSDTSWKEYECRVFKLAFEPYSVFTNPNVILIFNKKDSLLLYQEFNAELEQYGGKMKVIKEYSNHSSESSCFFKNKKKYVTGKKVTLSENKTVRANSLVGKRINLLDVKDLDSYSTQKLNLSDGMFLLDFWYMECVPCIKSHRIIDSFYNSLNNTQLSIIGINGINNNEKDRKKIKNFLQKNNVHYPNYLIDLSTIKDLGIISYPSFLVIKNGVCVAEIYGYSNDLYDKLQLAIRK